MFIKMRNGIVSKMGSLSKAQICETHTHIIQYEVMLGFRSNIWYFYGHFQIVSPEKWVENGTFLMFLQFDLL